MTTGRETGTQATCTLNNIDCTVLIYFLRLSINTVRIFKIFPAGCLARAVYFPYRFSGNLIKSFLFSFLKSRR